MAVHDTIGDFLTTIRNASMAKKDVCTAQISKMRLSIAQILKKEGFISDYSESVDEKGFKQISLHLKYVNNVPAITGIQRHSTPGRRLYYGATEIPRVLGGLGLAVVTTSKGVMRARDARQQGVGGELICKVW